MWIQKGWKLEIENDKSVPVSQHCLPHSGNNTPWEEKLHLSFVIIFFLNRNEAVGSWKIARGRGMSAGTAPYLS